MRDSNFPNPHYVDPNPYTGEADDEGVDYAKLMRERAAKPVSPRVVEEADDGVA